MSASNYSFPSRFKLFIETVKGGKGGKGLIEVMPFTLSDNVLAILKSSTSYATLVPCSGDDSCLS